MPHKISSLPQTILFQTREVTVFLNHSGDYPEFHFLFTPPLAPGNYRRHHSSPAQPIHFFKTDENFSDVRPVNVYFNNEQAIIIWKDDSDTRYSSRVGNGLSTLPSRIHPVIPGGSGVPAA